jgi:hypothetical protein
LPASDILFHRYEFHPKQCRETRRKVHEDLVAHIEAKGMKPVTGFVFGSRERLSHADGRTRIDLYVRHDTPEGDGPLLETVEYFPDAGACRI